MTIAALATLVGGIIIGYLGQRSRMCFVGAIRDFLLLRDTSLLKGVAAFGVAAWLAYSLSKLLVNDGSGGGNLPVFSLDGMALSAVAIALIGGVGLGVFSTLANGCPFRQHVRAAQGSVSSIAYLAGFYAGAVAFYWVVLPAIARFI